MNALSHGGCSKQLIVGAERREDYEELRERWFRGYDADAEEAGRAYLEEAVLNEWLLMRAQRNYLSVEGRMSEMDANEWTDEQYHRLNLMLRYKTAAERSFHRSAAAVERFRRTRVYEGFAQARADERANEQRRRKRDEEREQAPPEPREVDRFRALPKVVRVPSITQHVKVRVVDGTTVTTLAPSNETLREEIEKRVPRPQRVFRSLSIVPWVPDEYEWVPETLAGTGDAPDQVLTVDEWLRAVEREKDIAGGHIGPAEQDESWDETRENQKGGRRDADGEPEWSPTKEGGRQGRESAWTPISDPGAMGGGSDPEWQDGDGTDTCERPII